MNTKDVQLRLMAIGYALPKFGADGFMGEETAAALKQFQRARGIPVSGVADARTVTELFPPAKPVIGSKAEAALASQPKATRSINEIIVHCTATPEGRDVSVDTIRGWHIGQGWKDIGYHWVVKLDGSIEAGRPEAMVGSHVAGHNTGTLGVVYVGGVAADGKTPKDTRTPAQKAALLDLVKALIAKYPTVKKVTGHNQYAAKACPSFDVRKDELGKLI
jgi:N-acetylmuramoyl-L-alanine amidase